MEDEEELKQNIEVEIGRARKGRKQEQDNEKSHEATRRNLRNRNYETGFKDTLRKPQLSG